jgi:hypothetical protein
MKNQLRLMISIVILILFFQPALYAQDNYSLSGKVTNINGKGVAMTTIVIKADTLNYGGSANKNGEYNVEFGKTDSITVIFSCVGYDSKTIKLRVTGKEMTQNVVLEDKGVALENVEVNGNSYEKKFDKLVYLPSKKQVNAANSGVGLLANLMIPLLDVNRITKTISAINNAKVSLYIDGRDASQDEVEQLRPKDVQKVEFYEHPYGRFSGKEMVVNYILKHYEYGGYVDVRERTSFIYPTGDYSGELNIDHKKMNYIIYGGTGFTRDKGSHGINKSIFNFPDNPFERETRYGDGLTKTLNDFGVLRATYDSEKLSIKGMAGLMWSETPDAYSHSSQAFTPAVDNATKTYSESYDKSVQPFGHMYLIWELPKKNYITSKADYSFTKNNYRRFYTDYTPNNDITSNVNEWVNTASGEIEYTKDWGKGSNLDVSIYEKYGYSHSNYTGTTLSKQTLMSSATILSADYSCRIANKVFTNLGLSTDYSYYKVNDKKIESKPYLRPSLAMSYSINDENQLSFTCNYINSSPSTTINNAAEQRVDKYTLMRGNPNLDVMHYWIGNISYGFYKKNWNSVLMLSYFSTHDMAKEYYFPENGMMVNTSVSDGNFHSFQYILSNTIYLLGKNMQLKFGAKLMQGMINGDLYAYHDHYYSWWTSLLYMTGRFSVSAYYDSRSKMVVSTPETNFNSPDYGLSVTYGHKNLYIEAGCRNIFDKNFYKRSMLTTPYYSYDNRSYSKSENQQVYVSASYNFDFGREIEKISIGLGHDTNSSILRPK